MLKRILKNVKLHSLRSALSFKTEPHLNSYGIPLITLILHQNIIIAFYSKNS